MHDLQSRDDMARLYTESAGLATLLADRYPQALCEYLRAVYAGTADSDSLARLTGVSDAGLDRLYGEYLEAQQHKKLPAKPAGTVQIRAVLGANWDCPLIPAGFEPASKGRHRVGPRLAVPPFRIFAVLRPLGLPA